LIKKGDGGRIYLGGLFGHQEARCTAGKAKLRGDKSIRIINHIYRGPSDHPPEYNTVYVPISVSGRSGSKPPTRHIPDDSTGVK
jgi:hypothetical protein